MSSSVASDKRVHPSPFLKIASLVFHSKVADTVESFLSWILALDKPGKTCSSFSMTLSGVLPATNTHEHTVLAAMPVMTGGNVATTKMIERESIASMVNARNLKNFFMNKSVYA